MSSQSSMKRFGGRTLLAVGMMLAVVSGLFGQEGDPNHGYVGIDIAEQGPPIITIVFEGTPAEAAGIRVGDLLVSVNGVAVTRRNRLAPFEQTVRVGEETEIVVRRGDRELTLTVMPGTYEEVFGKPKEEVVWVEVDPGHWDSVYVQIKELKENHIALQYALKEAEQALAQVEIRRPLSDEQEQIAAVLQLQIDSISQALTYSYELIRLQADSMAAWTLHISPKAEIMVPENVTVVVPDRSVDERTITIYSDAVAGARFKALDEDQAEYFQVEGGLLVVDVVEDTPAYNAGLRDLDVVIEVDGEPVSTIRELRRRISAGQVELTYVRKGRKGVCTIGND
jgi:C-terminal processing protease CtpA/Prc